MVSSEFTFRSEKLIQDLQIYDSFGRKLIDMMPQKNPFTNELQSFLNGVYNIVYNNTSDTHYHKFLKMR